MVKPENLASVDLYNLFPNASILQLTTRSSHRLRNGGLKLPHNSTDRNDHCIEQYCMEAILERKSLQLDARYCLSKPGIGVDSFSAATRVHSHKFCNSVHLSGLNSRVYTGLA